MTAGMAEIIADHRPMMDRQDGYTYGCDCGWHYEFADYTHAIHVAEELAKAGYGNVADAWDEGATAGWKQSGEGFNAEYPDESTGECSVDLSPNPYREPSANPSAAC